MSELLPDYYANRDFFTANVFDVALKSDRVSMEEPFFSLSTKPDLSIFRWNSKDGKSHVQVTPSVLGRATQMDKDVLIYLVSQLMNGKNIKRADAHNRRVRFTVYDYLMATNKPAGGKEYERLEFALDRLKGTTIKTNIQMNAQLFKKAFGLIDDWCIVEKSSTDTRMVAVQVTLSEWLFNAICANEVLTLHKDYFRLRQPLARRLYEIARKHCGNQAMWKISFVLLHEKSGSLSSLYEFRRMVRGIAQNGIPEYKIQFDGPTDQVIFLSKDPQKLIATIIKNEKHQR